MVTVFTPTYNRAHLLPRLYNSLKQQDCKDFEWLVIDDGSNDGTAELFNHWKQEGFLFPVFYYKVENGGKQRAINKALELARGEYFFIVDSDDYLTADSIAFIRKAFDTLPADDRYIGISCVRGDEDEKPIGLPPKIVPSLGYVDCSNLERSKYNLQSDMAEAYYTSKIRKYKFPVWGGEKFTPEAVVWDKMAMDGYILRWYGKVSYICEYQEGGLTKSSWSLLKRNPMGYAMLFNNQLRVNKYRKARRDSLTQGVSWIFNTVIQFISCCCLAGEYGYIRRCESPYVWLLLAPGYIVSLRRRWQFLQYLK